MKTLITGGLGQIGSHVAEMMLERGDDVLVIDNLATALCILHGLIGLSDCCVFISTEVN